MAWHTFVTEREGGATIVRYHEMKDAEHRERHKVLHECADELFADYILNHPGEKGFMSLTVHQLMAWSHRQTIKPDKPQEAPVKGAN